MKTRPNHLCPRMRGSQLVNLDNGVQGLLSPTEPVPTPTLLCANSSLLPHCERLRVDGGLPSLEARGSTTNQILKIHSLARKPRIEHEMLSQRPDKAR